MKNIEKYGLTLVRIYTTSSSLFGVTKEGMVSACVYVKCNQCIFSKELNCEEARRKWLNEEAK